MKVLIIQQKMIGDVLTSTILFDSIKKKHPDSILHYLVNSHTIPVIKGHKNIDKVIEFTPLIENSILELFKLVTIVYNEKYDIIIDVYGKLSSQLIINFSGSKIRIGEKKPLNFFLSDRIDKTKVPTKNVSLAIENRLRLLAPLSIPFEEILPKIYLNQDEKDKAFSFLKKNGISIEKPLYMIGVLGSDPTKTYPFAYMSALLDSIIEKQPHAQLLFNYIPIQEKEAKEIYELTNTKTQKQIYFDVFGEDLRSFLAISSFCDAMIGNEGGGANMSKALGVPNFIIFSPYLNKLNWFGQNETPTHIAVHLSDFTDHGDIERDLAKKEPKKYYLKFKPSFIMPKLIGFLENLE